MEMQRLLTLRKELQSLEASSSKLYNRAYKARYDHASKDWKAYRKVYTRLRVVQKELAQKYRASQESFSEK